MSVQDAAAQLAAPLLDLSDGQRVLDACAAPGGRRRISSSRRIVSVTALDEDAARLRQANLARLGLTAQIVRRRGRAGGMVGWRTHATASCSTCRALPASRAAIPIVKWLRRPDDVEQFARARRLLDALWQLLRRDGKCCRTCSVFHEENHSAGRAVPYRATRILTPDARRGRYRSSRTCGSTAPGPAA